MKNKKAVYTTKWISYTAMFTALIIASGLIPPIPLPPFGNLYWCDGLIFIASLLLSPVSALVCGGLGTFLYDVIHGNSAMMFASLIIHGLQAFTVSVLFRLVFSHLSKKLEILWAAISSIVGGLIVIAGYFIFRYFVSGNEISYAGYRAVANVIQELVGITLALAILYATTFKRQLEKSNLLPDFKKEFLADSKPKNENSEE